MSPGNNDYHKEQRRSSNWTPSKLQHPIVTRSQKIAPEKSHHKSGQVKGWTRVGGISVSGCCCPFLGFASLELWESRPENNVDYPMIGALHRTNLHERQNWGVSSRSTTYKKDCIVDASTLGYLCAKATCRELNALNEIVRPRDKDREREKDRIA